MTLFSMSFYGAVIIFAILLIRAFTLHKLPKKTFLILWGIALLRLLIPFEITSGFSIYSLLPEKSTVYTPETPSDPFREYHDSLAAAPESGSSTGESTGLLPLPVDLSGMEAVTLPHTEPETQTVVGNFTENYSGMGDTAKGTISGHLLFPVLWGAGLLLCAVFFLVSYVKCYREFCTSLPVTEHYAAEWLKQHPLKRRLELRQSDKISAPLTYGIFHPVILLPKKTDWENKKQLDYVLYHEFTHIRRFDLVAKLVMIVALCLHWFNPLVWAMYFFFNRDLELSCDECVVQHFEEAKASYARTLISMEERRNYSTPLCNHFSKNAIEERITSIMKSPKTTRSMLLLGVAIVVVVSITLTTNPKESAGSAGPETTPLPTVTPMPTPSPTPWPTVTPWPTATPSPTPDHGPTATPPLVTATPSPNPEPTPKLEPETSQMADGTYAAIVQGCKESSLLLEFVEIITDADVKRKEELSSFYGWTIENGDLNPDGSLLNGYFVHGSCSGTIEYRLAQDIQIRLINYESKNGESPYIETSQIHLFLNRIITEYGWSKTPYFFEIENGIITSIHEKILP